jgi:hypothetical protein
MAPLTSSCASLKTFPPRQTGREKGRREEIQKQTTSINETNDEYQVGPSPQMEVGRSEGGKRDTHRHLICDSGGNELNDSLGAREQQRRCEHVGHHSDQRHLCWYLHHGHVSCDPSP